MSACIILFIFGTVLTGGYMLVTSSITNEHSSVKIASTYLEAVDIGHTKDVSILWIEGATKRACEHVRYVQIESAAQYTYEHIEYIRQQALPDFLKDIAKTAKIWLGSSD
jgi:TRAP-type C4-dicarboxylate transport system permease small subunit